MPWYHGESVLDHLESVYVGSDRNLVDLRLPIQYVMRPDQDFRGYAGQIASGVLQGGRGGAGAAVHADDPRSRSILGPDGRRTSTPSRRCRSRSRSRTRSTSLAATCWSTPGTCHPCSRASRPWSCGWPTRRCSADRPYLRQAHHAQRARRRSRTSSTGSTSTRSAACRAQAARPQRDRPRGVPDHARSSSSTRTRATASPAASSSSTRSAMTPSAAGMVIDRHARESAARSRRRGSPRRGPRTSAPRSSRVSADARAAAPRPAGGDHLVDGTVRVGQVVDRAGARAPPPRRRAATSTCSTATTCASA